MKEFFRDLLTKNIKDAKVILTGIPFDKGCSCGKGAKYAPQVIRELSSFLPPLTKDGYHITNKIFDNGDLKIKNVDELFKLVKPIFDLEPFKIFMGGDHSVSIATEKAFIEKTLEEGRTPAIIHIDAHPDICDYYDGSKNSHACPNARSIENGCLPKNITLIGIRGYELQEVDYFKAHPELKVYSASFLNKQGIDSMIDDLQKRYHDCDIYLSYDIDANDPSVAPGTGTPEAFGLSSQMVLEIILRIISTLSVKAMDLVEISPPLDNNNITSWLALKTLYEIIYLIK